MSQTALAVWTREWLYREVWDKPLAAVAERLEVNVETLVRVCRRHEVPVPAPSHHTNAKREVFNWMPPLAPASHPSKEEIVIRWWKPYCPPKTKQPKPA